MLYEVITLIPDGPEESFHFTPSPGLARWRMDQMDTQIGTGKFKVLAGVTGPVVRIKPTRLAMGSNGCHQFHHHYLGALAGKKAGMNHISCGIISYNFV